MGHVFQPVLEKITKGIQHEHLHLCIQRNRHFIGHCPKVAGGLGDASIHSIPNRLKKTQGGEIVAETARIGLVFPCYFGSISAIVLEFVRKLDYGRSIVVSSNYMAAWYYNAICVTGKSGTKPYVCWIMNAGVWQKILLPEKGGLRKAVISFTSCPSSLRPKKCCRIPAPGTRNSMQMTDATAAEPAAGYARFKI